VVLLVVEGRGWGVVAKVVDEVVIKVAPVGAAARRLLLAGSTTITTAKVRMI
jgi:hypothetical protein